MFITVTFEIALVIAMFSEYIQNNNCECIEHKCSKLRNLLPSNLKIQKHYSRENEKNYVCMQSLELKYHTI